MARDLGDHDSVEADLTTLLPPWMPRDPESGNWSLLAPIAKEIESSSDDVDMVDTALSVQDAETTDQLREKARVVDVVPRRGESFEKFRARVLIEFQLLTSKGRVSDVLGALATTLDIPEAAIDYDEEVVAEPGVVQLKIPGRALDNSSLNQAEVGRFADRLIAGEYRAELLSSGTFTYVSSSAYGGAAPYDSTDLNSDAAMGHDGLDSNDDPKDNGGTYAGVLE